MQNIQNAVTHAQSSESLARRASEQMFPVRKHSAVAHRLPIVRLLPRATGFDARGEVALKRLFAYRFNASTFSTLQRLLIFILHSEAKVRKVSH